MCSSTSTPEVGAAAEHEHCCCDALKSAQYLTRHQQRVTALGCPTGHQLATMLCFPNESFGSHVLLSACPRLILCQLVNACHLGHMPAHALQPFSAHEYASTAGTCQHRDPTHCKPPQHAQQHRQGHCTAAALGPHRPFTKFSTILLPFCVMMLSGWNCTPWTCGYLWRRALQR
jgi:hypothetical protein